MEDQTKKTRAADKGIVLWSIHFKKRKKNVVDNMIDFSIFAGRCVLHRWRKVGIQSEVYYNKLQYIDSILFSLRIYNMLVFKYAR